MRGWAALFQHDYPRGCPSLSLPVLERQGGECSSITCASPNAAPILFQNVGASVPLVRGLTPLRCTLLRKSPPKRKLGRATLESRNARDRLGHPPSSYPLGMPLIACSSASKSSCRSSV